MKQKYFLFISSVFFIYACNQNGNPVEDKSGTPVQAQDTMRIIKDFKGLYKSADQSYVDCDHPGLIYKVINTTEIDTSFKKILPRAYNGEAIYAEINAEVSHIDSKIYAGSLKIKKILKTEQKNFTNTCVTYDYWGKGTEPFWMLQISKAENLIDYYDPMQQKTTHYLYAEPKEQSGVLIYNSSEENNPANKIQISIRKEKCSDGMSEKQYDYRMDVITDRRMSGCAVKFGE